MIRKALPLALAVIFLTGARAQLVDSEGKAVGTATLTEVPGGVRIALKLWGLPPGTHAFHI
ncbi:MAG: superoxide dismutase, partial [Elusimicrobia bacterium]|nr:superoxide dismutase [Elusimicrobiota bacterium]